VARQLKVAPSSANRWHREWKRHGEAGLRRRGPPGARRRLSQAQLAKLEQMLLAGPMAAGYTSDLWTLERIAKLIKDRFQVRYHTSGVWFLLGRLGWSCQRPAKQAKERDEEAIRRWLAQDWPRIKRGR
jgi:transposase